MADEQAASAETPAFGALDETHATPVASPSGPRRSRPVDGPPPSTDEITDLLRNVIDPELGSDIVELGMARAVTVDPAGRVELTVALTTAGCPLRAQIQRDVRSRLESHPGVAKVTIRWDVLNQDEKAALMATARRNVADQAPATAVPPTARILMIASGKGGVGKSSLTANLAAGIAARGYTVGVLDADIWGFSIPRMLGVEGRLQGAGPSPDPDSPRIAPHEVPVGAGRLKIVSMGFLVDTEDTALMWRGLMLNRAVRHFLEDVAWGHLDYLLIDMPPGTGDVQMGLARMLPRAEMLVVTTPARAAQRVAARVANMGRANYLRIVGVVENMSEFVTPAGEVYAVFGSGGGQELADDLGVPLLGSIPIDHAVPVGGDTGRPTVIHAEGPAADALHRLVELIVTEAAPPVDLSACSAHVLAELTAADAG